MEGNQGKVTDPFPERTPCLFDGCRLSTEEHHRLNAGLREELRALKRRVAEEATLLSEVSRRLR